jgi:hypothetical protein
MRLCRRFAFSGFALCLVLVASRAETAPVSVEDVAAFLAGTLEKPSPLDALTHGTAYRQFVKLTQSDASHFEKRIATPIREWSAKWLPSKSHDTVLYPFAGPDFINAYLMYPNAKTYVLIGLEHGGRVPALTNATLAKGLSTFRNAMRTLTYVNFFVTNRMEVEIDEAPIPGVTPVVLAMMARLGLTPLSVEPIHVNGDGALATLNEGPVAPADKWGAYSSVEIRFLAPDKSERRVLYLSMDLSDAGFKRNPKHATFLKSLGRVSSLIKAGSYLMHSPNFTTIRDIVLTQADVLVQDDSGVPFRQLKPEAWTIKVYGVYTAPIRLFKNKYQADLKTFYGKDVEKLGFPWGYGNDQKQSNLLLAIRKATPSPTPTVAPTSSPTAR